MHISAQLQIDFAALPEQIRIMATKLQGETTVVQVRVNDVNFNLTDPQGVRLLVSIEQPKTSG